jgi:hypothetical protein
MERRQDHLIKCTMAMAAFRGSMEICADDVDDADTLLRITEARMPEAFGEFGLTPLALARSRIMALLQDAKEPLTAIRLSLAVGSDVKMQDVKNALFELQDQGMIIHLDVEDANGNVKTGYLTPRANVRHHDPAKPFRVTYAVKDAGPGRPVKGMATLPEFEDDDAVNADLAAAAQLVKEKAAAKVAEETTDGGIAAALKKLQEL